MPTVILLDVSLSMLRPIQIVDGTETTRKQLAILGIQMFLDNLNVQSKLEFTSLMTFSSNFKEKGSFTRDYNQIKAELQNIEDFDKTCIENALHGVNQLILNEWGNNMACQIILVTDGSPGVGSGSLKESLLHSHKNITNGTFPLPFPFPAKLHVVCISQPNDPQFLRAKPLYQRLIDMGGYGGSVQIVDNQLNEQSVLTMFKKLAEDLFVTYNGTLKCGHLESKIYLSPAPIPFTKQSDFNKQTYTMAHMLEVCGFVSVADIGSPMAISRHLILPIGQQHQLHHNKENQLPQQSSTSVKMETDAEEDPTTSTTPVTTTTLTSPPSMTVTAAALTAAIAEDGKTPSFCVLLHGALKVENMAALVQLDTDWFGFVYSWADTKKKSNLMLTVLKPGTDSVPWLGDFHNLHCAEDFPVDTVVNFPLRPAEKRSYSQNSVVWIRQAGLQSDIQKILRHARKLPEKTQHFYKELNRLRKAAVQMGFLDLLISLSYIFEQECTQLPGSAHPDCALQLTHAADVLRKTQNKDLKHVITPLPTNYTA